MKAFWGRSHDQTTEHWPWKGIFLSLSYQSLGQSVYNRMLSGTCCSQEGQAEAWAHPPTPPYQPLNTAWREGQAGEGKRRPELGCTPGVTHWGGTMKHWTPCSSSSTASKSKRTHNPWLGFLTINCCTQIRNLKALGGASCYEGRSRQKPDPNSLPSSEDRQSTPWRAGLFSKACFLLQLLAFEEKNNPVV